MTLEKSGATAADANVYKACPPHNPNHPEPTRAWARADELGLFPMIEAWREYDEEVWGFIISCPKADKLSEADSREAWLAPVVMTMLMMHAEQSLQLAGLFFMADIGPLADVFGVLQGDTTTPLTSAATALQSLAEWGGEMTEGWTAERLATLTMMQGLDEHYQHAAD